MPEEITDIAAVDFGHFIVLESNDHPTPMKLKVRKDAAKMSGLIKDMLEDQEGDAIIPVPNVTGKTLKLVLEYIEYHYNNRADTIEKPLKGKLEDLICPWDKEFLYTHLVKNGDEKQHETLIDVIMAANFLNIKDLLDLTCACVASMIKGKSPEQIRALFNIENDFTPEEEEKIKEENRWCDDS